MSDVIPAEGGQDTSAPATGTTVPTDGQGAYFTYEWEDGEKQEFATQDDLKKHFREGTLRHRDYTKKRQADAELRKTLDDREGRLTTQANQLLQNQQQHDGIRQALERLDPKDYASLVNRAKNPNSANIASQVEKQVGGQYDGRFQAMESTLKSLLASQQSRDRESQNGRVLKHLASQYEDFDLDAVQEQLEQLGQSPPEDDYRSMAELAYWARKGKDKSSPEARAAAAQRRKAGLKPPMMGGVHKKGAQEILYNNLDEAKAAARKDSIGVE